MMASLVVCPYIGKLQLDIANYGDLKTTVVLWMIWYGMVSDAIVE